MEDEGAWEDGFLPVVGLICCRGGYRRLSEDRLRGGSCGLGFSFGFVGGLDMVKRTGLSRAKLLGRDTAVTVSITFHYTLFLGPIVPA